MDRFPVLLAVDDFQALFHKSAYKDPFFNGWNTIALEIFYLLFRGVKPDSLVVDQARVCALSLNFLQLSHLL